MKKKGIGTTIIVLGIITVLGLVLASFSFKNFISPVIITTTTTTEITSTSPITPTSILPFTTSTTTSTQCSDGTLYNKCSINKPFYCDNGNLIQKCTECGCPTSPSQFCDIETNKCFLQNPNWEVIVQPKVSGQQEYVWSGSYDDNVTFFAWTFVPGSFYPVKEIKIFLDGNQIASCSYVRQCNISLPQLSIGEHPFYAVAIDESGLQKQSQINNFTVMPYTIHHSPSYPSNNQQVTITFSLIPGYSVNSVDIIFFEYGIMPERLTKLKTCSSFPCSVTVGPFPVGRHSYQAKYYHPSFSSVDSGGSNIKDLWVYTSETYNGEGCKSIYANTDPNKSLDIVFIGHGYDINDFSRYATSVEEAKNWFLNVTPFKTFSNRINFWRVDKFEDLGCDESLLCDPSKIKQVASLCPYDQIIVSKYGDFAGVSGYYYNVSIFGDNTPYEAVHEFGHAFGGLADEYASGGSSPNLTPPDNFSLPNCYCLINQTGFCETEVTNTLNTPGKIYVNSSIPCPKWSNVINTGCYIGCGGFGGGGNWFRPISDGGIMKDGSATYFDPVSLIHLTNLLNKFFSNQSSCTNDFDCPENMKCQNSTCADVGCLPEGGVIPGGSINPENRKHMATICCSGLQSIQWSGYYDDNCKFAMNVGGPSGVCSKCGNGICESWETKCTCAQDCK